MACTAEQDLGRSRFDGPTRDSAPVDAAISVDAGASPDSGPDAIRDGAVLTCEARSVPTRWWGLFTYLGPVEAGPIVPGRPFSLRYALSGSTSEGTDRIVASAQIDTLWGAPEPPFGQHTREEDWRAEVTNADGSGPFDLVLGPEPKEHELRIRVIPPSHESETFVMARLTPCAPGSSFLATNLQRLRVGEAPPAGDAELRLRTSTTDLRLDDGPRYRVPRNGTDVWPHYATEVDNRTDSVLELDMRLEIRPRRSKAGTGADWHVALGTGQPAAFSLWPGEKRTIFAQVTLPPDRPSLDASPWVVSVLQIRERGTGRVLRETFFPMIVTSDP